MNTQGTITSASLARQALHEAMEQERWTAGEKLPPERELCETLGVKRMSLRQALLTLENEGAIFRIDRWKASAGSGIDSIGRSRRKKS